MNVLQAEVMKRLRLYSSTPTGDSNIVNNEDEAREIRAILEDALIVSVYLIYIYLSVYKHL